MQAQRKKKEQDKVSVSSKAVDAPHMTSRSALRKKVLATPGYEAQAMLLRRGLAAPTKAAKKTKPFTVAGSGTRKVLVPKKPNGKSLYFFFGYTGSKKDQEYRDSETMDLEDDVLSSVAKGFKVVYDKAGTRKDLFEARHDQDCYGIYWSGHGFMNGNVESSDGPIIRT